MVEHCRIVIMVLRSAICRHQYTARDIRPECAHAELFRYNWWCWGRRAPAASARRAGPGIAHAPRPLCSGRRFIPTHHGLTTVSLRLHQGRGVNCSHITLLLTASAAGDQPRRHVQKEVMPLPKDRTARFTAPATYHASLCVKDSARDDHAFEQVRVGPKRSEQSAPC